MESKSQRRIALETGLSYVTVHKIIPLLVKRNLVKLEIKGRANLILLDFEQADLSNLSSAMLFERTNLLKKHPELILLTRDIEESLSNSFYSMVIFGSYAKGDVKKNSDIDLLFIVPERRDIEKYYEKIKEVLRLYPFPKKDFQIISTKDFVDMLNQKYTVGRSVFQHGIVLFGVESYYAMVKNYVRTKGY